MKYKTSYYIDYGTLVSPRFKEFDTLKKLKNAIKQELTKEIKSSFELYAKFKTLSTEVQFEFAGYDHVKDTVYRYNLRKNIYYKRLKWCEKSVFPILKTHGVKK